ncbi:uncharacterized protein [Argopecten irradians]|uniref:uncharacterized protein isoform X2 n=1 Tax=Argopecten irradians TaxID=31199 RepID=UPI0037195C2F
MATNIPDEAIGIHNEMVDDLSTNISDPEFQKLKRLFGEDSLTGIDMGNIKSVQELFACLVDKVFIFYGDYEQLMPKLEQVKPRLCNIVQDHAKVIRRILNADLFAPAEMTIMMHRTVYETWEGSSAAFVDCKIDPVPNRIVWKRDKTTPLRKKVLNDNHKYYYSPASPTLVIRDPNKTMDEARYQCWAEAKGKIADGDIVHLHVAVPELKEITQTSEIEQSSEDQTTPVIASSSRQLAQSNQSTAQEPETAERTQESENESSRHTGSKRSNTLLQNRKRTLSGSSEDHLGGKRVTLTDHGCRITFGVTNEIDITRLETENDIIDGFEGATGGKGRVNAVRLMSKCIQVCIYILAAKHPSDPSSIHLAEEFKHYLLDGGTIQLSDESQTVLQIDETSIQITPHSLPKDEQSSRRMAGEFKLKCLQSGTTQLSDKSQTVIQLYDSSFEITPYNSPLDAVPELNEGKETLGIDEQFSENLTPPAIASGNGQLAQSTSEEHIGGKRVILTDQGCRILFDVTNEIDITRQETENDIIDGFEKATGEQGRVNEVRLVSKCIQVCLDISAAKHPSDPSSIHLAEEFKHYLLDGGTIQLSDESRTVLQTDNSSFEITPYNSSMNGSPCVYVSHGHFTASVGKPVIIQTYVTSSPALEAISIQWYKEDDGDIIPVEIDNKRYYGGCDECPTLIIRETTISDQGRYRCSAINTNGVGWSDTLALSVLLDKSESKVVKVNKDSLPCKYHEEYPLDLYCDQCNLSICIKCLPVEHQNHLVFVPDDINLKKKVVNFIEKSEKIDIVSNRHDINATDTPLIENTKYFQEISQQIQTETNRLKEELDIQSAQALSHFKMTEEINAQSLQKYQMDMELFNAQLSQNVQQCRTAIQTGSSLDIYRANFGILSSVTHPVKPILINATFSPEEFRRSLVEKSFGVSIAGQDQQPPDQDSTYIRSPEQPSTSNLPQYYSVQAEERQQTEKADDKVLSSVYTLLSETRVLNTWESPCFSASLCPTNDGKAWTSHHYLKVLTLLDRSGNLVQTMEHRVNIEDIYLSPEDKTLWACDIEHNVLKSVSGQLVNQFSTNEKPLCICITYCNNVLIGETGGISKYSSGGMLVRREPLVGLPNRMSECPVTRNIAVTDWSHDDGEKKTGSVVVMNSDMQQLFAYDGTIPESFLQTPKTENLQFNPSAVVYDSAGNLAIGDHLNKQVLLISGLGNFLRIVHTDNNWVRAIGIDKEDTLWVVVLKREVRLLQYSSYI